MRKNHKMLVLVALSVSMFSLAGCGTKTTSSQVLKSTPSSQNQTHSSSKGHTTTASSANKISTTASHSQSTNANKVVAQSTKNIHNKMILEKIQVANSALVITTTYGNLQTAYANPQIINGNPKEFVVTLKNTIPGKFKLNQPKPISSNWGTSMEVSQVGNNLKLTFQLKSTISSYAIYIGYADMMQIQFK